MTDLDSIVFRYFADPHNFSTYQSEPNQCDLCRQIRPGYHDAFFTSDSAPQIRFVCEPCLFQGRLESVGGQVNIADQEGMRAQIGKLRPDLDSGALDQYVTIRSREVEVCTPSITTWQDYEWPTHCGDYMRYVKEIGQADCVALSNDNDGKLFFETYLDSSYKQGDSDDIQELWEKMSPDSPVDNSDTTATSFYLFQCLICKTYLIEWDSE